MICKHDWKKISEIILPSAFEQITKKHIIERLGSPSVLMYRKKLVIVLKCKKCGKLDKTVESSPY